MCTLYSGSKVNYFVFRRVRFALFWMQLQYWLVQPVLLRAKCFQLAYVNVKRNAYASQYDIFFNPQKSKFLLICAACQHSSHTSIY